MSPPDVTVIIPVYNTVDYLRVCLESLVHQTINDAETPGRLEVIAVDDGSTDGCGEVLDEYAAAYPNLFRVFHQENSGGPAGPCNVGLDNATGRFVFFLGSDDYLGPEATERMVAKADEWGSDVVGVRLVGAGGRLIPKTLFAVNDPEITFPDQRAWLTANTKLFRRSVLEEHGVRYRPSIRVASDQTFTIEAMYRASRISVLGDYDYYFAMLRDDESNLMHATGWQARLDAIEETMAHIAALIAEPEIRDAVLVRHFRWEYANKLRDLESFPLEERREVVERTLQAMATHYTPLIAELLPYADRVRLELARSGDLAGLEELNSALGGANAPRLQDLSWNGDELRIRISFRLLPSMARSSINLAGPGTQPMEDSRSFPARSDSPSDDVDTWVVDLPAAEVTGRHALRFGFELDGVAWETPVPMDPAGEVTGIRSSRGFQAEVQANKSGRAVLVVDEPARRVRGRLGRIADQVRRGSR